MEDTRKETPRTITIQRSADGYGFNIRGQTYEGGQIKAIHGKLYAPLQYVSAVTPESLAAKAGLHVGDMILEINDANVEGASHNQVVDLIKNSQNQIRLVVIASTDEKPTVRNLPIEYIKTPADYSERRSIAITIPDYSLVEANKEKFYVFNIHIAGRHLCSRRFREFDILHLQLKQEFPDFTFSSFPSKWPFKLSPQQLDARRRGLEQYLEKVCSVRVIGESDAVQDFLSADIFDRYSMSTEVEIQIILLDRSISAIKINRFSTADKVYQSVVEKIALPKECQSYFYLFEIIDRQFERKLRPNEYPFEIHVQNSRTAKKTCLSFRKFFFSPSIENSLLKYPPIRDYLYREAINQLQHSAKSTTNSPPIDEIECIKYAQTFPEIHNIITFPLCSCSSRKDNGYVIPSLNSTRLRLSACDANGKIDTDHIATFDWTTIERYYVHDNEFVFEYKRATMKSAKPIKLQTEFAPFMYDCFDCLFRELQLTNQVKLQQ